MSGPYDQGMAMPMHNMMDGNYQIFNGAFNTGYPQYAGAPGHFDGGFWYNPPGADQLYDRDSGLFGARGVAMSTPGPDSSNVKHRRTRSGCFTCRNRRVKVCEHAKGPHALLMR
jgi:hypothetical protein